MVFNKHLNDLKKLINKASVKRGIVVGASALALLGIAGVSNNASSNQVHADGDSENIPTNEVEKIADANDFKYNMYDYSQKQIDAIDNGANQNDIIPAYLPKRMKYRIEHHIHNTHKVHKVHTHKVRTNRKSHIRKNYNSHRNYRHSRKSHKHSTINKSSNVHKHKNHEIKTTNNNLSRIDYKLSHSHGKTYRKLIKNIKYVNSKLNKLTGKRSNKHLRGYKNHTVKSLANTLNRVDYNINHSHGKKRAKLLKAVNNYNSLLSQLA